MKSDRPRASEIDTQETLIFFCLFFTTVIVSVLGYRFYFNGGETYEFCHYAEIARRLLRGQGFSTAVHYPSDLATLEAVLPPGAVVTPVVFRFPLFAFWSALWMKMAGAGDFGMALGNGVAHGIWVAVLYLIGKNLFDRRVALWSCALFIVHPALIAGYDIHGYPDVLFGALFGIFNFVWWQTLTADSTPPKIVPLGAGLLGGLCYLTRQTFAMWLPLYLLSPFLFKAKSKATTLGLFAAGFLLCGAPWFMTYARNFGTVATPQFAIGLADGTLTERLPWLEYRTFFLHDFFSASILIRLAAKGYSYFNQFLGDWPKMWLQPLLFPFCIVFFIGQQDRARNFGRWMGFLLATQVLLFSFLRYEVLGFLDGRYSLWAAPFFLLYGVAFFFEKWNSVGIRRWFYAVMFLHLQFWALIYIRVNRQSDHKTGLPVSAWPEIAALHEIVPPFARVASNSPTQIGWYADRPSVNIPRVPEQLAAMAQKWPIEYLYISKHRIGEPENYPLWFQRLAASPAAEAFKPLGFAYVQSFDEGWLFKKQ